MFGTILLIDDDNATNYLHKYYLEEWSICERVMTAADGRIALEFINTSDLFSLPNNLILLDINMPVMNGFEFLEKIQELEVYAQKKPLIAIMMGVELNSTDLEKIRMLDNIIVIHRKMLSNDSIEEILSYLPEGVFYR